MTKALIYTALTLIFALILAILGAKDEIKWPLSLTTSRGWWIFVFITGTFIVGILSYTSALKNADLVFNQTPEFYAFNSQPPDSFKLNVIVKNEGDLTARSIDMQVDLYYIKPDRTIEYIDTRRTTISRISGLSTLAHMESISPPIMYASTVQPNIGLIMYVKLSYNDSETTKTIEQLVQWSNAFGVYWKGFNDKNIYNSILTQIKARK